MLIVIHIFIFAFNFVSPIRLTLKSTIPKVKYCEYFVLSYILYLYSSQPVFHVIATIAESGSVAFSGSLPPKFEHKIGRHKQRIVKIAMKVLLDYNESLL